MGSGPWRLHPVTRPPATDDEDRRLVLRLPSKVRLDNKGESKD